MRHLTTILTLNRPAARTTRTAILTAMLGAGIAFSPVVVAQEATPSPSPVASPAASPVAQAEVQSTLLMQASFDQFVPAPMTVRMLRITVAPGASVPMHTHPGPEFDRVEAGTLTAMAQGEAGITRGDGTEESATAEGDTLETGDWILYPAGTGMSWQNQGEEDVVILSSVVLPVGADFPESITYTEGSPSSAAFEGVSFTVLGDGLVQQFPSGPATVTIDSLVVPDGTDLPAADGVAMYSHVNGNFSFVVNGGAVQVSRSELESLQPNAIPGEEFTLAQGDAAFFPAGVTATSRANETSPLELLRLTVTPQEPLDAEAATLTFAAGTAVQGEGTGGAEAPETTGATGAIVTTNSDSVNMRAEPTVNADVVDQLAAGVELEVIGGPTDADGYTWYQVRVTAEGGSEGWVASEFLEGDLSGAAAAPAPTPAPAAEGTPAAPAGTFAIDSQVVTNDENVRVRAGASVNADIVDAFPSGTAFVITGEPQQADEFTWYPVALASDETVTGWIAADFLAPATSGQ